MWPFGKKALSAASVPPPVDLNEPVENPALVAAIAAYVSAPSPESLRALLREVSHAVYLMPTLADDLRCDPSEKPNIVQLKKDSTLKVLTCEKDGRHLLPLFTDWPELRKWTDQPVSGMVVPATQAWESWARHYDGVVINPAGMALPLHKDQVQALSRVETETVPNNGDLPAGAIKQRVLRDIAIQTRRAQRLSSALAAAIRDVCEREPEIAACYVLDARRPGSPEEWLLIAFSLKHNEQMERVAGLFLTALKGFPEHERALMQLANDTLVRQYAGAEFYRRA